jgi:hypothetical protein
MNRGIRSQASDTGANPIAFSPFDLVEIGRGMKTPSGLASESGQLSQPHKLRVLYDLRCAWQSPRVL